MLAILKGGGPQDGAQMEVPDGQNEINFAQPGPRKLYDQDAETDTLIPPGFVHTYTRKSGSVWFEYTGWKNIT